MRAIAFFAGLIGLVAGHGAWAQAQPDWTPLSTSVKGTQFFARNSELLPASGSGASPSIWVKQTPSAAEGVEWNEGHALYRFNCPGQSYEILSVTLYYPGAATQIHSGEGVVRAVTPGTPLADLVARVCPAVRPISVAAATTVGKNLTE